MNILTFIEYLTESTNINENDGILIIVDVQKQFDKFIPQNFENNIMKYCDDFPKTGDIGGVYQIWDSNKAKNYTYTFPNTVQTIRKNYGTMFDNRIKNISERLLKKYPDVKEGDKFKLKRDNSYLVKINNNHKWFYVNEELYNFYNKIKGKKVVLIGGADNECLEDVYISMKSFGIYPVYNHDYIYSADTNDQQVSSPKQ